MTGFLIPLALGAAGSVAGKLLAPKPKAAAVAVPSALPTVQRRANSAVADALASRTGSRGNRRTGPTGAEAGGGGLKSKLGT